MSFDQKSFDLYKQHSFNFDKNFTQAKRKAHARDWQPIRLAVRDQVIGLLVLRHQTKENIVEVDVFMTEDPSYIKGYGGTKMAVLFILSTAYKCGSTMGIRFTKNVEDGSIPTNLIEMADSLGIELKYISEGFITPKESRMLYMALTGFSTEVIRRIKELSVSNIITPERICYMVHHNIWKLEEMEAIILGCEHPEWVLDGTVDISDYLKYLHALYTARSVILGGFLDQKMKLKEVFDKDGQAIDVEASDRQFDISFDPNFFARVFLTKEQTPIPWTVDKNLVISPNQRLVIAIRGYDWPDFCLNFERDREAFRQMKASYQDDIPTHFFVVIPRDIIYLPENMNLDDYRLMLQRDGIVLMVCPELVVMLDDEAQKRFQKETTIRHDVAVGESAKRAVIISKPKSIYNSPELIFVAVAADTKYGVVDLSKLIEQSLYDEVELSNKVNRYNVEARYHRCLDRIAYVGKVSLLNQTAQKLVVPKGFLGELIRFNLTKMVYSKDILDKFIDQVKNCQFSIENTFFILSLRSFLESAQNNNQTIILTLDMFAKNTDTSVIEPIGNDQLEATFKGQFVLDRVIDYSDKNPYQVAEQMVWNGVNRAKLGQSNSVNLGELPHVLIAQILNMFLYKELKDNNFPIEINVVYTDGSRARPFPLCRLKKRKSEEMKEIRQLTPIKIGMMSCRHEGMDELVDRYWFRNIEVNMAGKSTAEKDEFAYQTTKSKLAEILKYSQPVRIAFYQTGFEPIAVGFYRALSEFLIETSNLPPQVEVVPYFYNKNSGTYTAGPPWC